MSIRKMRPITNGTRHMTIMVPDNVENIRPLRSLTIPLKSAYGRDNQGHRTAVNRSKGHKRLFRIIDFKRNKKDVEGVVNSIEYDPNRTASIARIHYVDGEKRYILAPYGLKKGDKIAAGKEVEVKSGNAMKLADIPIGVVVHNIELKPGQGARIARSAGTRAKLAAKDGDYCYIEMPSKELRMIHKECMATIGYVSNPEHELEVIGKAGRARLMGHRPHVRGSAKNPVDHPHGGGNGKAPIGRKSPVTPKGLPTLGRKTRSKKKHSSKYIISRKGKR
jgi:large subunit ribosomal protein L2